jgi:hypothetical protein
MPEVVVIEFEAPDAIEVYRSVNRLLDVDPATGSGDWPAPLSSHIAAASGSRLIVVEVWDSQADQHQFMERLGAAFKEANVSPPKSVEWFELAGERHRD